MHDSHPTRSNSPLGQWPKCAVNRLIGSTLATLLSACSMHDTIHPTRSYSLLGQWPWNEATIKPVQGQ